MPTFHITALIRRKNKLRKLFQRHKIPSIKQQGHRLTNRIKLLIKSSRIHAWNNACSEINSSTPPAKMWRSFKTLTGCRSKIHNFPTLKTPTCTAYTDLEKATLLNNTLSSIRFLTPLSNADSGGGLIIMSLKIHPSSLRSHTSTFKLLSAWKIQSHLPIFFITLKMSKAKLPASTRFPSPPLINK